MPRPLADACAAHLDAVIETAEPALAHARGLIALSDGSTGVARSALEDAVVGWDRHRSGLGIVVGAAGPCRTA